MTFLSLVALQLGGGPSGLPLATPMPAMIKLCREDLFFFLVFRLIFETKSDFRSVKTFFFGLHLIFGTKSALRSVKTFLCLVLSLCKLWVVPPNSKLNSNNISCPPLKSPKSDCEDFFCGLAPFPQSKILATPVVLERRLL